ncbi:hypothetical protein BGW37DRAFT_508257 [Umbelopsis sp. PMI_123]|nr:hypothetical protein BGW37DRAFT_508257 [Umbelopsis sp. PMI_123]
MKSFVSLLASLCFLSLVLNCAGHITFTVYSGQPGSYLTTALRVPHGCNGSSTTAISTSVPDSVYSIKPEVVANWNLTLQYHNLTTPVTIEGTQITQTVTNITWSNYLLPNDQFQAFGLQMQLPETGYNGTNNLWFPVMQTCVNGSTFWAGIQNTTSMTQYPGHPAPHIQLINASTSSSAAQSSVTGVQNSASSVSLSMAWSLLFMGMSLYAKLA